MFINYKLETALAAMVQASLNAANVSNWDVVNSFSTGDIGGEKQVQNPIVEIVCGKSEPLVSYVNTGYEKYPVSIMVAAFKGVTTDAQLSSVADVVFNPFLTDTAESTLAAYDNTLIIKRIFDMGNELTSVNDSWLATLNLDVVVARMS